MAARRVDPDGVAERHGNVRSTVLPSTGMRRSLVALGLVGSVMATAAPPPRGRVLRVERPRAPTLPHFCEVFNSQVLCFGPAPQIDEHITLIDTQRGTGLLGEFRVESVAEATDFQMCPRSMYRVTGTPIGMSATQLSDTRTIFGVRGIRLDNRTRVVRNATAPRGDETVTLALDTDADGTSDLIITQYACDAAGRPTQPVPSGRARVCFDSYLRIGRQLERVVQDVLQQCP